jgi:fatty-acyl-CoA synthase
MISMHPSWWIRRWAESAPEKTAIVFEGETTSYARLWESTEAAACWLQSLGIEKGDRVAVVLENSPELVELYLAATRVGAVFVPLNYRLTGEELQQLMANSAARLLVFSDAYAGSVSGLSLDCLRPTPLEAVVVRKGTRGEESSAIDYHLGMEKFRGQSPVMAPSQGPSDPEEPQVIMYTSGTTGRPKGAVLSHRKTFFNCLNADIFFDLSFSDRMLIVLPMFHSGGLFIQAAPCFYKGATVVLHPRFDATKAFDDMSRYEITKFLGVPTVYRALFAAGEGRKKDLSHLRVCAIGGERVTPEVIRKCWEYGFPVREVMGQTETSILLWASETELMERPDSVGRPVFHAQARLVNKEGKEVPPGEVGEIVVQGSILMSEYWRDPAETEKALAGGWLHTGDLARRDDQGYFYLVDRAKDMYISGGENVYPAEVERVLRENQAIVDAAVLGVPDDVWGEVGHAFIILRDDALLSEEEVTSWCRARLAGYKIPRRVSFCSDFPKTAMGKVRKYALLEGVSGAPVRESPSTT